jgi:hypothetical protein
MNKTCKTSIGYSHTVKVVKAKAFGWCTQLTTVTFANGLEEIGKEAFEKFTSQREISVPTVIKVINNQAFRQSDSGLQMFILAIGLKRFRMGHLQNAHHCDTL